MYQESAIKRGIPPELAAKMPGKILKERMPFLDKEVQVEMDKAEAKQKAIDRALDRRVKEEGIAASKAARDQKAQEGSSSQNAARGFGKRIEQAEQAFKDIAEAGYDRSDLSSAAGAKLPNVLRSDDAVRNEQAERNFINAVLRRESGAAISDSEFSSAEQQYFPRAGDGPETLKQKAENRRIVLENMKKEAGRTWDETPKKDESGDDEASKARQKRIAELKAKQGK